MRNNKSIVELEKEYVYVLKKQYNIEHYFYERMSNIMKNYEQELLDKLKNVRLLYNNKVDKIDSSGIYLKNLSDDSMTVYSNPKNLNIKDVIILLKEVERLLIQQANKRQLDLFNNKNEKENEEVN